MPFPINFTFSNVPNLFGGNPVNITIYSGLTVFVGPNGSGKTQFLKYLRANSHVIPSIKGARYLSAGRLGFHEHYRANVEGGNYYTNPDEAIISGSNSKAYRLGSESAMGDFFTLGERTDVLIKVSERLRKLFKRDVIIEWTNGNLRINFKRVDESNTLYTSAREASGLLHLVSVLTALYSDEMSVLFIDEPEVSLHPQLQAFLRMEIEQVAGDPMIPGKKAIIISTHSTEFITIRKPEDICKIVFFSGVDTPPIQLDIDTDELKAPKIRSLLMRMGYSHKTAFFAKRPLLVEGPSDEIICSSLEGNCNLYLNAAGSQILPVIGKDQMPIVARLFQAIGKTPVILTDLDGIADGTSLVNSLVFNDQVEQKAQDYGHRSVRDMAQTVYSDYAKLIEQHWSDLGALLSGKAINEDKQRKRVLLKFLLNADNTQFNSLPFGKDLSAVRARLVGLLNILEEAGCFVLRKGTIEDYYSLQEGSAINDKITLAALEAERLITLPILQINSQYADVIRALKFASQAPDINEAAAVSELLLSFASPAISKLNMPNPALEIKNMASRLLAEKASLFTFDIEQSNGEDVLIIDKNSVILNVQGFPIKFTQQSNPNEVVKTSIKPS